MRIRHPLGLVRPHQAVAREERGLSGRRDLPVVRRITLPFGHRASRARSRAAAQAVGPLSLKCTVTVMITGVGTPLTSVGV